MVGNRKTLIISFIFILLVPALVSARTTESIDVQAAGAVIMDQKTGRVFYGKNEHEKMRIASITKIMTAIIAIESGKLDDLVTVSERAVKAEGSSIYLQRGEKIQT